MALLNTEIITLSAGIFICVLGIRTCLAANKSLLLLLCVLHAFIGISHACTIITASSDGKVLFAGNEDQYPNDSGSFMVIDKEGTYGVVYFATTANNGPLGMQMGINEKGLCFDFNWIPKEKIKRTGSIFQSEFSVFRLMKSAASVEEVVSRMHTLNWGSSMEYQVHFADRYGDAVVIHPGVNGELSYTRKTKNQKSLISTNFNLAKTNKFKSMCARYAKSESMLEKLDTEELTVEFMASVLSATHQDSDVKTIFSSVYDTVDLRIYLYANGKFDQPFELDIEKELRISGDYRKVKMEELLAGKPQRAEK